MMNYLGNKKMVSNKLGKIYDGKWKVVDYKVNKNRATTYTLKNIYNDKEMTISSKALRKVEKGETTISKVCSWHLQRERKKKWRYGNF